MSERTSKICVMAKMPGGERPFVANPCKVPSITRSNTKNATTPASSRGWPSPIPRLHPVFLKDEDYQQMLRCHAARNMLVSQRTQIIN